MAHEGSEPNGRVSPVLRRIAHADGEASHKTWMEANEFTLEAGFSAISQVLTWAALDRLMVPNRFVYRALAAAVVVFEVGLTAVN